jgi:hypothetical protein
MWISFSSAYPLTARFMNYCGKNLLDNAHFSRISFRVDRRSLSNSATKVLNYSQGSTTRHDSFPGPDRRDPVQSRANSCAMSIACG